MATPAQPLSSLPFRWGALARICYYKLVPALPSKIQIGVFLHIYGETVATPGRPLWATVNVDQLARLQKASSQATRNALEALIELGFIQVCEEKNGRCNRYRVALESLNTLVENLYRKAEPRKLTLLRKPPQKSAERRSGEEDCKIQKSNVYDSTATCEFSEFRNAEPEKEREDPHEISPPMPIVDCPDPTGIQVKEPEKPNLATIPPNAGPCPYCSSTKTQSRVSSVEQQAFERWAYPDIARIVGAPPPAGFSSKIFAALGDAPLEDLKKRVVRRIKVFTGWGLLLQLATDVHQAHQIQEAAKAERQASEQSKHDTDVPWWQPHLNEFMDGIVLLESKPTRDYWLGLAGEAYDLAS